MTLLIICYALGVMAALCFAMSLSLDDDAVLALVWPLWLARSVWRAWRHPEPGTEQVRVVYRYPARTRLARAASWLWRVGMTAAAAWLTIMEWRTR